MGREGLGLGVLLMDWGLGWVLRKMGWKLVMILGGKVMLGCPEEQTSYE